MPAEKQYPISIANDEILLDVLLNLAHDTNTAWEITSKCGMWW